MKKKSVSIHDVADKAGVSISTVSHVINDTKHVSSETKQRVLATIRELSFQPNAAAKTLKSKKSNIIVAIIPDITNYYFAAIIEEVEDILTQNGYHLMIVNTREDPEIEKESLSALSSISIDGILIASTLSSYAELHKYLPGNDIPIVFIDRVLSDCPCDTYAIDNYQAMYTGVESLVRQGHKKIGYITGLIRLSTTSERLNAYKAVMKKYNYPTEGLIQIGNSMRECVNDNLERLLQANVDALVVSNNVMANEAMLLLTDKGILVGTDISMLCYKDSNVSQFGLQHTSLIVQPTTDIARYATKQLLNRIKHPDIAVTKSFIQASFIEHLDENKVKKENAD